MSILDCAYFLKKYCVCGSVMGTFMGIFCRFVLLALPHCCCCAAPIAPACMPPLPPAPAVLSACTPGVSVAANAHTFEVKNISFSATFGGVVGNEIASNS